MLWIKKKARYRDGTKKIHPDGGEGRGEDGVIDCTFYKREWKMKWQCENDYELTTMYVCCLPTEGKEKQMLIGSFLKEIWNKNQGEKKNRQ